ncbi:hypothetical protein NJBCHELONAE_48710 [Mycobacteroides chelonae]|uniref:hypothetical protein n=1 Tax=Mycobacteroides chelonae TaxID=1774 RepID=UPI0021DDD301|nr:hypothetical protein [Mycobacteroides chelonae]GLE59558.1 hypothetical protein NJBCHELONAE_48710 [Mycobacteroides chelonae]
MSELHWLRIVGGSLANDFDSIGQYILNHGGGTAGTLYYRDLPTGRMLRLFDGVATVDELKQKAAEHRHRRDLDRLRRLVDEMRWAVTRYNGDAVGQSDVEWARAHLEQLKRQP